jgi:hypothetical protein
VADIISTISSAISLTRRLKTISDNIKDAEFKNLLADLTLQLADVKLKLASILEENVALKQQIKENENTEGDPCPKCRMRSYQLVSSKPDSVFGEVGGVRRLYKCSSCEFSEEKLITG